MRTKLAATFAIAAMCLSARAKMIAPFDLEQSAWDATDIVVVTQGETLDGNCTVFETWKGSLPRDNRLAIPALKYFAQPQTRVIQPGISSPREANLPASVSGTRLVLFLKRSTDDPQKWEGTNDGEMLGTTSVVWIEDGKAFAGLQERNPGPLVLRPLRPHPDWGTITNGLTEEETKLFVLDEVQQQSALTKAAQIPDLEQRKQALKLLTASKLKRVSDAAATALAGLEAAATPPAPPSVPADAVPDIQLNAVPLGAAIRSLARQAGLTVELNPKLNATPTGEAVAIAMRPITTNWSNTSPRKALDDLLDKNGLLIIQGLPGKPMTVVNKAQN